MRLAERIRALEEALAPSLGISGAHAYAGTVRRMAERYPPEAAETLHEAREQHFTVDQRLAWVLRFGSPYVADRAIAQAAANVAAGEG